MMRVLVVDGDPDVRGYLVSLLEAIGHEASGVGSVEASGWRAGRRAPDAVLCAAKLPDGDGIKACRRLKRLRPDLSPIIMAWDRSGVDCARRAALGPVLIKPFSPSELKHAPTLSMVSLFNASLIRALSELKTRNAGEIEAHLAREKIDKETAVGKRPPLIIESRKIRNDPERGGRRSKVMTGNGGVDKAATPIEELQQANLSA